MSVVEYRGAAIAVTLVADTSTVVAASNYARHLRITASGAVHIEFGGAAATANSMLIPAGAMIDVSVPANNTFALFAVASTPKVYMQPCKTSG